MCLIRAEHYERNSLSLPFSILFKTSHLHEEQYV